MQKKPILIALGLLITLVCCRAVILQIVHKPSTTVGSTLLVEMKAFSDSSDFETPVACINAPTGWDVANVNYSISPGGDDLNVLAAAASTDATSATDMQSSSPGVGFTWWCYRGPATDYTSSGTGSFFFSVDVTSAGMHRLRYALGQLSDGVSSAPIVKKDLAVNLPAAALDAWSATELQDSYTLSLFAMNHAFYRNDDFGDSFLSRDGKTWSPLNIEPFSDTLAGVVSAENVTIAVGATGVFRFTPTAWNEVFDNGTEWRAIAHGEGTFVAVGTGQIATSANGIAWSVALEDVAATYTGIAWGNGRFVALNSNGASVTSETGATWSAPVTEMAGGTAPVVVFGNGIFVASDTYNVFTSPTGVSWTTGPALNLRDQILFDGARFFAVSYSGVLLASSDGVVWTEHWLGIGVDANKFARRGGTTIVSSELYYGPSLLLRSSEGEPVPSQKSYVFPTLSVGNQATKRFVFTNIGTGDTVFGGPVTGDSTVLQVIANTCAGTLLSEDATCYADVRFQPASADPASNTLYFEVTVPTVKTLRIKVTGNPPVEEPGPLNTAPTVPELVSPLNNTTGLASTTQLIWKASTDVEEDAITYRAYVCDNADFHGCDGVQTAALLRYKSLLPGAMALVMFGFVFFPARRRATTLVLLGILTVGWGCSPTADLPPASPIAPRALTEGEKEYIATNLKPATTYYWKIVASDAKGSSSESEVRQFTTK